MIGRRGLLVDGRHDDDRAKLTDKSQSRRKSERILGVLDSCLDIARLYEVEEKGATIYEVPRIQCGYRGSTWMHYLVDLEWRSIT